MLITSFYVGDFHARARNTIKAHEINHDILNIFLNLDSDRNLRDRIIRQDFSLVTENRVMVMDPHNERKQTHVHYNTVFGDEKMCL